MNSKRPLTHRAAAALQAIWRGLELSGAEVFRRYFFSVDNFEPSWLFCVALALRSCSGVGFDQRGSSTFAAVGLDQSGQNPMLTCRRVPT